MGTIIASLLGPITGIISKVVPDVDLARKISAELETQLSSQEFQLSLAQSTTNVEEAKSPSLFVAGWRPAVGWICAFALFYQYIAYSFLTWANATWEFAKTVPPPLNTETLMTLLFGMLGLGTLRTYDKLKKTDTKSVGG